MKRNNKFFSMLYVVLCLAFFYLPILVTMIFSFNSSKSLTRFTGFSLRWYQELLGNGEVIKAVYVSVTIAIIATIVSTILGTITAIGLSKSKKVIKELLLNINNIPILNPEIVTAISLMLLFSSLGFRKGYLTMLLAHIAFCTPYVITSVYPKVRALDPNMANAAMDLGATPFQALPKVIVPMFKNKARKLNRKAVKIVSVVLVVAGTAGLIKWGFVAQSTHVLKVYNAGEYMELSLLEDFEKEYDCTIVYETFESNEMMYTKLSSGETYDVLIPSDYMIERLIKEEYLQALDWKEIPNKKNLLNDVMNQSYDPGNRYSCPYFWGTVGILYDKTVVDEADLKDGWNLLCNPKYKGNIYMYDSERDSFMIALKALGYSMNTTNESEIEEAYQWLIDQRDTMDPIYAGDDVIDNMISGNKALAVVYSGDASYIISENPNLDYFTPEQGTNRWYDAMVITKDCSEVQLAHEFINFMISDKSALSNTEEVGYTSTVKSAFETMKEGDYAGISSYIPDTTNPNNEIFAYQQPKIKQKFAELWTKVKAK